MNKTHQKIYLLKKVTSAISIELNCILEVAWWEKKTMMIFSTSNEPKLYPLTYECISIVFTLFEVLGANQSCFTCFHSPVKYSVCWVFIFSMGVLWT